MVVKRKTGANEGARAHALHMRQDEAQRPDDVRRLREQHLALGERLAHEAELVVLEIAQAAVDQLRAVRGRGTGEVAHLSEQHLEAAAGGVGGDAGAVDAAADDRQIVNSVHHGSICAQTVRQALRK